MRLCDFWMKLMKSCWKVPGLNWLGDLIEDTGWQLTPEFLEALQKRIDVLKEKYMLKVILESPYAGDIERNIRYAKECIRDSLKRGEAPLASHLLYTQEGILDDNKLADRFLGIDAGHAWIEVADLMVVYQDYGITAGMQAGINEALTEQIPIEYRNINPVKLKI